MHKCFSEQIEMLTQIMGSLCTSRNRVKDYAYEEIYNIGGIYVSKHIPEDLF